MLRKFVSFKWKYTMLLQIIKVISLTHSSNLFQTTSSKTFPIKYTYLYISIKILFERKIREKKKETVERERIF